METETENDGSIKSKPWLGTGPPRTGCAPARPPRPGRRPALAVKQPLLYAGYWYARELHAPNAATGWYWLTVRPYDPALRRFTQPDPSMQEGIRSYVYVGDDPVDATDPSGLACECGGGIPVGGGGGGEGGGGGGVHLLVSRSRHRRR